MSDLTYVRVGIGWNYVCLFVDLYSREIVGHAAGARKDACLVKLAFATLDFPLAIGGLPYGIRGSEFDNMAIDELLSALGIKPRSPRRAAPTTTRWTSRPTRF